MRNKKFSLALISGIVAISTLFGSNSVMASDGVKLGDKAPDFTLQSQDGKSVSLHDFAGQKSVVLYFYPKDNTPGCTKEACTFRDAYEDFNSAGAEVIGVSSDSEESHKGFAAQHKLPFKLLADKDGKVRKLYGVPSSMGIMPGRVTYVIDKQGIVKLSFNSQLDAPKHVSEALAVIKTIDKK